jgi:hypothetical protein
LLVRAGSQVLKKLEFVTLPVWTSTLNSHAILLSSGGQATRAFIDDSISWWIQRAHTRNFYHMRYEGVCAAKKRPKTNSYDFLGAWKHGAAPLQAYSVLHIMVSSQGEAFDRQCTTHDSRYVTTRILCARRRGDCLFLFFFAHCIWGLCCWRSQQQCRLWLQRRAGTKERARRSRPHTSLPKHQQFGSSFFHSIVIAHETCLKVGVTWSEWVSISSYTEIE